jgi:pilus assembly protein Flp/PilA
MQVDIRDSESGGTMIYLPAEDGQGLVEYALIIMLIALVLIAIVTLFGTQLSTTYSSITSGVEWASTR